LARNARVGRLELDLIARRDRLVVFCEVRTRSSDAFMDPIASIDRLKVQRIRSAAVAWLRQNSIQAHELRFDAASVVLGPGEPKLTYYEAAF
jgi:putative endonuclease